MSVENGVSRDAFLCRIPILSYKELTQVMMSAKPDQPIVLNVS
jgi:hypothetical protein